MNITERRFREASGQQFLGDGKTVRCQARSKYQMNAERDRIRREMAGQGKSDEEIELYIEEATKGENWGWPEFQCTRGEIPGAYKCKFHGGKSKDLVLRDVTDFAPYDLKHALDVLRQNPDYLSQKEEITVLTARFWSLFEKIKENQAGDATWDDVMKATEMIAEGDVTQGIALIRAIAKERLAERETYREINQLAALLSNMRSAEVKNIQTMRHIITEDQYSNSLDTLYRIFENAVIKTVDDERTRQRILSEAAAGIREYINAPMGGVSR